jgi:NAD(P)-dependent dehydrogenase (short-subunit alcohol dehydrogenase family)
MATVLITGANRGLGLEFARQYAADGWTVIGTARDAAGAGELASTSARVEQLDTADLEAVAGFGARIAGDIDLLIANAATDQPKTSDTAADGRAWADMLTVNSIAPFLLAQSVASRMGAGGKLVAISSQMGSIGDNRSSGYIPYRTSKAALNAAWHSLAIDVRPQGLIAAVVHPGWVKTRMGGPNALISPERSVTSLRGVIEGLTAEQSGGFFDYDGTPLGW